MIGLNALRHITSLSPFGPIFGKELRTTARRKRTYFLRVLYLGGLMLFLLMAWVSIGSYGGQSVVWQAQQQARLGQTFFITFSLFCVTAMALIAPVLTSTAISSERLGKTLHVLLMTPITAWQIIAGKLFSRLLVALTLIGLSLPMLALVRLLGGVEASQMFGVICLCAVTALVGAAIGLFFSSFVDRAYASILLSYATLLFLYLFVPFVLALTVMRRAQSVRLLEMINPFFTTGILAWGEQRMFGSAPWVMCVILHLIFAAVLVLVSGLYLRRRARHAGERPAAIDPSSYIPLASIVEPASAEGQPPALPSASDSILPYAGPKAERHKHKPQRTVSDNPVLWREIRRPLMAKRWQAILGSFLCIGLLLVTYALLAAENDLLDHETQIGFAWIFNGLVMLLVCVLSSTAIAQEKESDTWTLLLATPISGWAIVGGKLLGQLRKLMWPMVLIVSHFFIFTLFGKITLSGFFIVIWTIVTFNAIWIATGIYLSVRIRKVTFAVILNLLLPVMIYAAVPIVLLILGELISRNEEWPEVVQWYLPYYYMVHGLDRWEGAWLPTGRYPHREVSIEQFLAYVVVIGGMHLALAGAILTRVSVHFNRIVGRANQRRSLALGLSDSSVSRLTS